MAEMKASGAQLKISTIIAKYSQSSAVKVPANILGALIRWVMELGAGSYCDEFLDYHSEHVNPTTLAVTPNWLEELTKASDVSHTHSNA